MYNWTTIVVLSEYFSYFCTLIFISKGLERKAKQIFLKRSDVFIKIPSKYHITCTLPPTYGLNKAVKNPPSNLNELDICMPVLVAMSSNCGFYYIPNFLLLPLPSAWFITGEEQYRCFFYLPFIILGPPDSYFLQMHHCFARSGCQLAFLVLVWHGIVNLIYFTTSFFFP